MAKNTVFIDVIVDDKGTTRRLEVDSKKLKKALGGVEKGVGNTRRQLRGAADMSSNVTKNFSKMQQGISGGIVPAYAELAARVFAVTAAFRFLQEAADTKNLIQGQQAFGAFMGTNYAGITKALQDATNGQLRYAEAAQATAIGTAAGLNRDQLEGLATAAKNVSFALGRDLTDSFQRLIRGVTKAEPELLDELGIILRLKPATEVYAAAIGKAAGELDAFERSQAVANFVLDEADKKFQAIAKIIDEDAFAVQQFGKAFDDVLNTLKVNIAGALTPVLKFLSQNVSSLIALFGLLALPLLKSVVPAFEDFGDVAGRVGRRVQKFADTTSLAFSQLAAQTGLMQQGTASATAAADALAQSGGLTTQPLDTEGTSRKGLDFLTGKTQSPAAVKNADKILTHAEDQIRTSAATRTGILKDFDEQQVRDMRKSYTIRAGLVKKFNKETLKSFRGIKLAGKQMAFGLTASFLGGIEGMLKGAQKLVKGVNFALKGIAFVGIAVMLFDIGKMLVNMLFPTTKATKKLTEEVDGLISSQVELNKHLEKVVELRAEGTLLGIADSVVNLGNALKEVNIAQFIDKVNDLRTQRAAENFEELKEELLETATTLEKLNPIFKGLNETIQNEGQINKETSKQILLRSNEIIKAGNAAQQLGQLTKNTTNEINKLTSAIVRSPFESLVTALEKETEARALLIAEVDQESFDRSQDEIRDKMIKILDTVGKEVGPISSFRGLRVANIKEKLTAEEEAELERLFEQLGLNRRERKAILDLQEQQVRQLKLSREAQSDILLNQEKSLLNSLKASEIDKVRQDFVSKRKRLEIAELNQENKILAAKDKVVAAELQIDLLREKGIDQTAQEFQNANIALFNAQAKVKIEENNLDTVKAQNAVKEVQIDIDERQLEIQKEINQILEQQQRVAARVKDATVGTGAIGRSAVEIEEIKRFGQIAKLESEREQKRREARLAEENFAEFSKTADNEAIERESHRIQMILDRAHAIGLEIDAIKNRNALLIDGVRLQNEELLARQRGFSLNPIDQAFQDFILKNKIDISKLDKETLANLRNNIELNEKLKITVGGLQNVATTFKTSFADAFVSIGGGIDKTREAFRSMANSILQAISRMLAELMVFQIMTSGLFGRRGPGANAPVNNLGTIDIEAGRYGMTPRGYSTGGIARGPQAGFPAMLHGTEAVIPMPNKKSIPVEFTGREGAGNTNNVVINISSDGTQQTPDSGDQASALGRAISSAVQDELHRQKRPGGILSPFGATG